MKKRGYLRPTLVLASLTALITASIAGTIPAQAGSERLTSVSHHLRYGSTSTVQRRQAARSPLPFRAVRRLTFAPYTRAYSKSAP